MSTLNILDLTNEVELSPAAMSKIDGGMSKEAATVAFAALITLGDISASLGLNGTATSLYNAAKGVANGVGK